MKNSAARKVTEEQIIAGYQELPVVEQLARKLNVSVRALRYRVAAMRARGLLQSSPIRTSPFYKPGVWKPIQQEVVHYEARVNVDLEDGVILVGSDAHYWPGEYTTAHAGFLRFVKELRPRMVVMNGDAFDGARISRFARIGWDKTPPLRDELKTVTARLKEIEEASGKAELYWPLGNHDARFETKLAQNDPEYEGIAGFSLKDHFPAWRPCWSVMVNRNLLITHRWKGGKYAVANNTLNAGVSMCTGHLHSLKWIPHTDETGTRYGIDCGTLAEPVGPQFLNYTEDNPKDWRSGFVVLTIHKGKLLTPEVAEVIGEGEISFRGTVVEVPETAREDAAIL